MVKQAQSLMQVDFMYLEKRRKRSSKQKTLRRVKD